MCVCAGTRKSMISTKFYNVPWLSVAAPMDFLQIQFWIKISWIQIWRKMILTDPEIKFCDLNDENLFIIWTIDNPVEKARLDHVIPVVESNLCCGSRNSSCEHAKNRERERERERERSVAVKWWLSLGRNIEKSGRKSSWERLNQWVSMKSVCVCVCSSAWKRERVCVWQMPSQPTLHTRSL